MKGFLKQLPGRAIRAALRLAPWIVTAGAASLAAWVLTPLAYVASDHRLALVGVGMIAVRSLVTLGAISLGSFALGAGLEGAWFASGEVTRRRWRVLAALGAMSMGAGLFVLVGRLAGFPFTSSPAIVGITGLLAGFTTWSHWAMRRRSSIAKPVEPARAPSTRRLASPLPLDEPLARDLGRVRTPAT